MCFAPLFARCQRSFTLASVSAQSRAASASSRPRGLTRSVAYAESWW